MLSDLKVTVNPYLPPGTLVLITRPRHWDEPYHEWLTNCVCIITGLKTPEQVPDAK
jgi:hypothetical protein